MQLADQGFSKEYPCQLLDSPDQAVPLPPLGIIYKISPALRMTIRIREAKQHSS